MKIKYEVVLDSVPTTEEEKQFLSEHPGMYPHMYGALKVKSPEGGRDVLDFIDMLAKNSMTDGVTIKNIVWEVVSE